VFEACTLARANKTKKCHSDLYPRACIEKNKAFLSLVFLWKNSFLKKKVV